MFTQVSLRGAPMYVRPEHVACIRAARPGESGASTIVLSCGTELASPFDAEQLCARLAGVPSMPACDPMPPPNSEQRAVIDGLYRRIDAVA